jgi:hypothetical protein
MRKHQFVHLMAEFMDAIGEEADPYAEIYSDIMQSSPRQIFEDSWQFLALAWAGKQENPENQGVPDTMIAIVAHALGLAYLYHRDALAGEGDEEDEEDEEDVFSGT